MRPQFKLLSPTMKKMNQNNNKQEKNGIDRPKQEENGMNKPTAYNEDDVTDSIHDELGKRFKRFMPYQRQIMIVGMIILIFLVVFLGYARGGLDVCRSLDGLLDSKFKCHPNYYSDLEQNSLDPIRQSYVLPLLTQNES